MSVSSSVYEFVEEFGRTYHKFKEGSKFKLLAWNSTVGP